MPLTYTRFTVSTFAVAAFVPRSTPKIRRVVPETAAAVVLLLVAVC
jgi:hypothetical protein